MYAYSTRPDERSIRYHKELGMPLLGETKNFDRRTLLGGAAALAGALALGVTWSSSGAALAAQNGDYPESVYSAKEYAFDGPVEIAAGVSKLTMQNVGMMDHHFMLLKFADGKTMADFGPAMEQGLGGLATLGVAVGGPGSASPGENSSVLMDLVEGNYVAMCLIPDDDGIPHAAKGMVLPITVTAAATPTAQVALTADATVTLTEFHFMGIPETSAAGPQLWEITNTGTQLHEMGIAKLAPGVTFEMVQAMLMSTEATPAADMAAMATPDAATNDMATPAAAGAPFTSIGGAAPMSPGTSLWYTADLDAGDYFAICFVPDSESGAPHFVLGMISPFTIS
jgi:hypothetical protein